MPAFMLLHWQVARHGEASDNLSYATKKRFPQGDPHQFVVLGFNAELGTTYDESAAESDSISWVAIDSYSWLKLR